MRYFVTCAGGHAIATTRRHCARIYCPTCRDDVTCWLRPPEYKIVCDCGWTDTRLGQEHAAWRAFRAHANRHPGRRVELRQDDQVLSIRFPSAQDHLW